VAAPEPVTRIKLSDFAQRDTATELDLVV
jgi:hypothetical protein